jgi:glyoxylase-like metal-dependent hydrolase (beta-lactamase superfamily II)
METVIPGLLASDPQPLPFAPSVSARAFLLERDRGSLLVYSVTELESELQARDRHGEISRQYLNHHHEAEVAPEGLIAPLVVHEDAREPVAARAAVEATYANRHVLDDDFEVIPTPGHTSGSTCFLWQSGEHRTLYTGDTIYLSEGEWVAAVLESSDRDKYIESLELIRELDFDMLVPWNATAGLPYHAMTDRSDARRRVEAILKRVTRGENR